jgi:formylglycine-generating enzyme required for sulfatase activity
VSLGDERTVGDELSGQETILDDIEVIDLAARYRIEGELGQGGMGAVLLATDTRLDRKVAIKRILGEAAGNRMAVNRFITEAKAIAALNHPNIVQIYDYGRAKDGPFLIMEFVDGGSLLDRCRDGAIPLESAVDLACQLCDGLAKAHDLGIIHRDIKPANVLLTKDGTPKLTDFGLAKAQAGDHGQTMTGAVLGTPDFMPPEQRRDASLVDHRSDLWSLAATVYQMVTGRSPKIIRFELLPAEITKVLGKALEDAKEDRYPTARDLRDAFKASLRAAEPAPVAGVETESGAMQEGQCTACGTVNSDFGRKFCRKCGGAMRVACLKCDLQIPVWDSICGECGANQHATLVELRTSLQTDRDDAEASARTHAYAHAISAAEALAALTHPALAEFAEWGRRFVATTITERDHQLAAATERLGQARSHHAAFDYAAAILALEGIPARLRDAEAAALLAECVASRDEAESLLRSIKERYERCELEGLIPGVERAIVLRGGRPVLQRLRQQLVERRDNRLSRAKAAFNAGDSRAARAAVDGTSRDDLDESSLAFVARVRYAAELEDRLAAVVKEAKASGKISSAGVQAILDAAYLCSQANPANNEVRTLISQLHANNQVRTLISQLHATVNLGFLTNSIGIELRLIPPGTFTMGDAAGGSDEQPHRVTLSQLFYIGAYEVTNAEWKRVMGSVPSGCHYDDLPVDSVSWDDAVEFCRKLSTFPEELAAGRVYRLPTEAEWEYACRAGTTTQYSFGDESPRLGEYAWFSRNSNNQSHAVGQKSANAFSLFDMHGNVSEWCSDWYGDYPSSEMTDPTGPSTGSYRVYRGGNYSSKHCRSAFRSWYGPSVRSRYVGFRLAMSLAGAEPPKAVQ